MLMVLQKFSEIINFVLHFDLGVKKVLTLSGQGTDNVNTHLLLS